MTEGLRIYTLFPTLAGSIADWTGHLPRIAAMGFNAVYVNPFHYPGFSGSLYAVKDYYRLNPRFRGHSRASDEALLKGFTDAAATHGLRLIMDLVVNHTAKDSELTTRRPQWFARDERGEIQSPFAVDPDNPEKKTVWGDLAELDYRPPQRDEIVAYFEELLRHYVGLGFRGFRCDAAYKVPAELWSVLIGEARKVDPQVQFFAETLGGPVDAIGTLRDAGFDYVFNSSKWWDFNEPWALEQNARFASIAPSVSFPESHDTPRLAAESGGREGVQRQRYAFAAAFSAGLMMPVGYEFGFRKQVNVVQTLPSDWEEPSFDLAPFIARVNRLKLARPELQGEPALHTPWGLYGDVLLLERVTSAGRAWILINKNPENWFVVQLPEEARVGTRLYRVCRNDIPEGGEPPPDKVDLRAAEVVYVL